jgi:hypothetical protein
MTMANPFSQKTRQRKFVYTGLILVLFTGSLMHRRLWVEPTATRLKLREVAKGEAELTSSAVRLSLTGSRGIAVTVLWVAALQEQERHEWNELELAIGAITKLQPYFITPWLFQGWNLAYNVAVECDRPHDKFYYVSRGLHLLAEGERRNLEQTTDPSQPNGVGQPDLRHFIGVAYQGKFGISDEKTTMRSLLDMSCIDPIRRDPDRFWEIGPDGRKRVKLDELEKFSRDYPRLVRRLREHLGYADPKQIVAFLTDNRELPGRFEPPTRGADQRESLLKPVREQFPVLPDPAKVGDRPPNPLVVDFQLRQESMDVFVASRAWFEYAQEPLPPPNPDPEKELQFDRFKYRLPKAPAMPIFRGYPCLAQSAGAEAMEQEGWFDADGWLITDWFDRGGSGEETRVGTELKYHAGPAWERTFRSYKELGVNTGQYLAPAEEAELNQKAEKFRKAYKVHQYEAGPMLVAEDRKGEMAQSWRAQQRLVYRSRNSRLTNFDAHFFQAEAEASPDLVTARKLFYQADRLRRFENPEQALTLFEAAWPLWIQSCSRFLKFAEQSTIQEDAYDLQLKHVRLMQKQYPALYRSLATGLAQFAVWPHPPLEDLLDPSDRNRILPIRSVGGVLDEACMYIVPERDAISQYLLAWSQAAGAPRLFLFPGQDAWTLVTFDFRNRDLSPGWIRTVDDSAINIVRIRLGLKAEGPPAGGPPDMAPPK